MKTAQGLVTHNRWNEIPYRQDAPSKSTQTTFEANFSGDLQGTASARLLMQYLDDTNSHYCGYLLFEGRLAGVTGSFILYELGQWIKGVATSRWDIVAGSGTGALAAISGHGHYAAEHDQQVHYQLNYLLAE